LPKPAGNHWSSFSLPAILFSLPVSFKDFAPFCRRAASRTTAL